MILTAPRTEVLKRKYTFADYNDDHHKMLSLTNRDSLMPPPFRALSLPAPQSHLSPCFFSHRPSTLWACHQGPYSLSRTYQIWCNLTLNKVFYMEIMLEVFIENKVIVTTSSPNKLIACECGHICGCLKSI